MHPTEISYDIHSAQRALDAIDHRVAFGFNFDPSHLYWQLVDPVKFIDRFAKVEQLCIERGVDMKTASIDELDKLWDEAKKQDS